MRWALVLACVATAPSAQEFAIDPGLITSCLDGANGRPHACIGVAAEVCMTQTPGGETTVGTGACLNQELIWWDARLNESYARLLAQHRADDADNATMGLTIPPLEDSLRAMQRNWITFRDAKCDHARATWGGGTGGGPATLACLLTTTAEQTFELESYVRDPN